LNRSITFLKVSKSLRLMNTVSRTFFSLSGSGLRPLATAVEAFFFVAIKNFIFDFSESITFDSNQKNMIQISPGPWAVKVTESAAEVQSQGKHIASVVSNAEDLMAILLLPSLLQLLDFSGKVARLVANDPVNILTNTSSMSLAEYITTFEEVKRTVNSQLHKLKK
jgi:hypothetical protein